MARVLLAAPNSSHKNYCFEDWLLNARSFNCDIFIADNSPSNKNRKLYAKHKIDYVWINPYKKTTHEFICESQNAIRNKFLAGNYTHLLFLETDLFPPRSILPLFECFNLPVVSASYFLYSHKNTMLMNQEIKLFDSPLDGGGKDAITRNYSLSESFSHFDGNLKRCYASGFGCTMIRRDVLEKLKFRISGISITGEAHSDSFFYADLQMNNIPAYMYMGVIVRHYNQDWSKLKIEDVKLKIAK